MRKLYILTLGTLSTLTIVNAQVGKFHDTRIQQTMHEVFAVKTNVEKALDTEIINKDYVVTSYTLGKIYYKGKEVNQDFYLRYNGLKDIIEVSKDGKDDTVLENTRISCTIGDSKYIYSKLDNSDRGYLKLIYEGKNSTIYEREIILLKKAKHAITSLTPDRRAKYVKFTSYYKIEKEGKIAQKISSSKKDFISNLKKEQQNPVKAFIKNEKINLRKKEDLIKVYKYLEMLN